MPIGTPLTDEREELYAQARAKLVPSRAACVQAGWSSAHNAARIERRKRVQNRIRELRYYDDVDIAWQRRILRQELMAIAMLRVPDLFVEEFEDTVDGSGNIIGRKLVSRRLRPLTEWTDEERAAIVDLSCDKDGVDRVKANSKTSAIELLMKLDGLLELDTILQFNQVNQAIGSQSTTVNVNARDRIAGRLEQIASRTAGDSVGA